MVQKDTIARDIPLSVICALLLLGLGYLAWGDAHGMTLGHLDGAIFLGAFAGYIFYMIRTAMKARAEGKKVEIEAVEELEDGELKLLSYPKSILCIVGGAVAIAFGGDMTVDAASRIAIDLGMSQTLVGLTILFRLERHFLNWLLLWLRHAKMKLIWQWEMQSDRIYLIF